MNSETLRILDSIARDRNIDRELLIEDLEQAMVSAARKHFNSLDTEEFGCTMDRLSGVIELWRNHEDGEREVIPLETMGRIPAQTAKQVIVQKVREAERTRQYDEYKDRIGEIQQLTYNPDHDWYYFQDMARDEAIVFKVYDSAQDGCARFTVYTSFDGPSTPADAPSRESIEIRTIAFFDEAA